MTLFHHSSEPYEIAASRAAAVAREKLLARINAGRESAASIIQQLSERAPADMLVPNQSINFDWSDGEPVLHFELDGATQRYKMAERVLKQTANRGQVKVPAHLINGLLKQRNAEGAVELWARNLLLHNLREVYAHKPKDARVLVRTVNDRAMGVVGSNFRREYDSKILAGAFLEGMQEFGAQPCEGVFSGYNVYLRGYLPAVFEPLPNEVMAVFIEFRNSDYGHGPLDIIIGVERLWCTNMALSTDRLHKVHIGARMVSGIDLSRRTLELESEALASVIKDLMASRLKADYVNGIMGKIAAAGQKQIGEEPQDVIDMLRNEFGLGKGLAMEVAQVNDQPHAIEVLPQQQHSAWRLSNALSWLAQKPSVTGEEKVHLQEIAGQIAGI